MPKTPQTMDEALKMGGKVVVPQTLDEALQRGGKVTDSTSPAIPQQLSGTDVLRRTADPLIGAGQAIGNAGMSGLQWLQDIPRQVRETAAQPTIMDKLRYLTGSTNATDRTAQTSTVTPTTAALQPNTYGQKVGSQLAGAALYALPAMATGGASLPAQVAAS